MVDILGRCIPSDGLGHVDAVSSDWWSCPHQGVAGVAEPQCSREATRRAIVKWLGSMARVNTHWKWSGRSRRALVAAIRRGYCRRRGRTGGLPSGLSPRLSRAGLTEGKGSSSWLHRHLEHLFHVFRTDVLPDVDFRLCAPRLLLCPSDGVRAVLVGAVCWGLVV